MVRNRLKIIPVLLAVLFAVTLLPAVTPASAASFSDTGGHWASSEISRWSELGIIVGSEGKFRPNAPITRGEMAVILDRIMGYELEANNGFSDISQSDFFYSQVLKANAAGVMLGSAGKVSPRNNITRQDAAVMIARAFNIPFSEGASTAFPDDASIASYAKGACQAMQQKGWLKGDSAGRFNPTANISRAEAVAVFDRILPGFVTGGEAASGNISGNLLVRSAGTTVGAINVSGDLYIAPGVGGGSVTLSGTTVSGTVYVMGGGESTVSIEGSADIGNVEVNRLAGPVRVNAATSANVRSLIVKGGSERVRLSGKFGDVGIQSSDVQVLFDGAVIGDVRVTAASSKVSVSSGSQITTLELPAAANGTALENGGQITTLSQTAQNTTITNSGRIGTLKATVRPKTVTNAGTIEMLDATVSLEITGAGSVLSTKVTSDSSGLSFENPPREIVLERNTEVYIKGTRIENPTTSNQTLYTTGDTSSGTYASAPPQFRSVEVSSDRLTVTFTFSEDIVNNKDDAAALKNAIKLSTNGTSFSSLRSTDIVEISGNKLIINFYTELSGSSNKVKIADEALKDKSGNVLRLVIESRALGSGTNDETGDLAVSSLSPSDNSTGVATNAKVEIRFNKNVKAASGKKIRIYKSNGDLFEDFSATESRIGINGRIVTISTTNDFATNTEYYITIDSGAFYASSDSGDKFAGFSGSSNWNFTTSNTVASSPISFGSSTGQLRVGYDDTMTVTINTSGLSDSTTLTAANNTSDVGVSLSITKVSNNKATLTITSNRTSSKAGLFKVTISASGVSSVSKDFYVTGGTLTLGALSKTSLKNDNTDSLTFKVTPSGIANGQTITLTPSNGNVTATVSGTVSGTTALTVTVKARSTVSAGTKVKVAVAGSGFTSTISTEDITITGTNAASITFATTNPGLAASTAATKTVGVTTVNIANNTAITASVTPSGNGLTVSCSTVSNNAATLTMTATSALKAGDYTVKLEADGVSTTKTYTVTGGSISLSGVPSTLTVGTNGSFTVSHNLAGSPALTVTSSNLAVATAAISGTTVTVTPKAAGSVTFTVSAPGATSATTSAIEVKDVVTDKSITYILAPSDVAGVKFGTPTPTLPTTVHVVLSDGAERDVPATWSGYNATKWGSQTLTGALGSLPSGVVNANNKTVPNLSVKVDTQANIASVITPADTFNWNITGSTGNLPTQISVTLDSGATINLGVTWRTEGLTTSSTSVTGDLTDTTGGGVNITKTVTVDVTVTE